MTREEDFCCQAVKEAVTGAAVRKRVRENGVTRDSDKEREKRALNQEKKINHTKVGFKEFWYECVDWDMIKLFYAMMMLFFTMVGVFTFIYLLYCFNYNEKMWYYYFPVSRRYREEF